MADETVVLTNLEEGDVSTEKITVDESNKGGVNSEFNEQQKAELAKLIQSNVDRTAQKLKNEYEVKIKNLQGQIEVEKQAKMTETERYQYEKQNYEKMKQDFESERLSFELSKKIADADIPRAFADIWLKPPKTVEELESRVEEAKSLFGGYKSQILEGFRKDNVRVPEGQKSISNTKTMKREVFEKLMPSEKTAYMRSGGKLE